MLMAGDSSQVPKRLTTLERVEREALIRGINEADGNKSIAAERLGIARSTLYRKMRAHGFGGAPLARLTTVEQHGTGLNS